MYINFGLYYWTKYIIAKKFVKKKNLDLYSAARMLKSLHEFITSFRDHFDEFEAKAMEKTDEDYIKLSKSENKNDRWKSRSNCYNRREKFWIETFLKITDTLGVNINKRDNVYNDIFGVFNNIAHLTSEEA